MCDRLMICGGTSAISPRQYRASASRGVSQTLSMVSWSSWRAAWSGGARNTKKRVSKRRPGVIAWVGVIQRDQGSRSAVRRVSRLSRTTWLKTVSRGRDGSGIAACQQHAALLEGFTDGSDEDAGRGAGIGFGFVQCGLQGRRILVQMAGRVGEVVVIDLAARKDVDAAMNVRFLVPAHQESFRALLAVTQHEHGGGGLGNRCGGLSADFHPLHYCPRPAGWMSRR